DGRAPVHAIARRKSANRWLTFSVTVLNSSGVQTALPPRDPPSGRSSLPRNGLLAISRTLPEAAQLRQARIIALYRRRVPSLFTVGFDLIHSSTWRGRRSRTLMSFPR